MKKYGQALSEFEKERSKMSEIRPAYTPEPDP